MCPNLSNGFAWQCYHVAIGKRNSDVLSNQTMVGCDELTLNSIQVAAPALR